MMIAVKITDLHFKYQPEEKNIIDGISLSIEQGEIFSIQGRSGCGKSTFCYCLCGIIPHVWQGFIKGGVIINNKPVSEMKLSAVCTKAGIVLQNPDTQLFSPTVEDEIAFGPENLCLGPEEIGRRIDESLAAVNLERYRYSHPENLSGGEKQLVAIASVLALHPQILILDESLSQLDRESRNRMKHTLLKLRNRGKTIIMVEHDIHNLDIADRIFFMQDGKLEEIKKEGKGELIDLYKAR